MRQVLLRKKAQLCEALNLVEGGGGVVVRQGLRSCIFKGLQTVLMVTHIGIHPCRPECPVSQP